MVFAVRQRHGWAFHRSSAVSGWGALAAQEDKPRGAVNALVYQNKPGGYQQVLARRNLDHNEAGVRRQPAGGGDAATAGGDKPAAIGRVRKTPARRQNAARGGRVASPARIWARSASPSVATLRRSAASASPPGSR